jgi:serine/threonine protein kinase
MTSARDSALLTLDCTLLEDSWVGASLPTDDHDELTGTTLNGTYQVERVLGEGGMGRVYAARHTRIIQKRVAVKVLHPEYARDRDSLARFQREAEAAASISHPNVVSVFDIDRTPQGMPYLVCEYLEGIELAEHLKRVGKLPLATAIHVARQLCQGLAAAHEHGVIHRDLKPQNVYLVGNFAEGVPTRPFVKVLDFGLSRVRDNGDAQPTKTGIIVGTPAFMPPEQALGRKADHRADVYGVGAILYKALTGHAPYDYPTPQAAVIAVMNGEPPRLRARDPSISVHVELVIERAMARDPAQRYANMNELARALEWLEQRLAQDEAAIPLVPSARTDLSIEAEEARGARPRLVVWLLSAAALFACTGAVAIAALDRIGRVGLSRLELGLSLLVVFLGALGPALMLLRRLHRSIWKNTSRVVVVSGHVRAGLFAATGTLALGPLAVHVVDDLVLRFVGPGTLPLVPLDAAWPEWKLVFPFVALVIAGAVVLGRRLLAGGPRSWQRVLGAWLWLGVGLAVSGGVVYGSLLWRVRP